MQKTLAVLAVSAIALMGCDANKANAQDNAPAAMQQQMKSDMDGIKQEHKTIMDDHAQMKKDIQNIKDEHAKMMDDHNQIMKDHQKIMDDHAQMKK